MRAVVHYDIYLHHQVTGSGAHHDRMLCSEQDPLALLRAWINDTVGMMDDGVMVDTAADGRRRGGARLL